MTTDFDNEVMYKLGRIESLLASMSEKMDRHISDTSANLKDHEDRIVKLEKSHIKVSTMAGTIGAFGAAAFEFLKYVTGH